MTAATAYTGRYPIRSHPTCAQWPDLALTRRENDALTFIASYRAEHGISPTLNELSAAHGLKAKSGAHRLVSTLEAKGAIRRVAGHDRSLVPLNQPIDLSQCSDAAIATEYARRFGSAQPARH